MSEPVKVCAVHMCTCARAHTHTQARAKEVAQGWATGRRGGGAYANLGTGHVYLNDFDNIVAYFEAHPGMVWEQSSVMRACSPSMGVALTLHVQAARQGPLLALGQAA